MRKHYTIESNTVTIKAGERAANVRIRGNYDAIAATDSLGLTLRLLTQQADQWDLYEKSYEAKVILQKCCPFDINLFNGYAVLTSTYMQEFMPNVDNRLIKAVIDPEEENTVIMKDFFYDGYDVKIRFTTNDILNPLIEMDEQTLPLQPKLSAPTMAMVIFTSISLAAVYLTTVPANSSSSSISHCMYRAWLATM